MLEEFIHEDSQAAMNSSSASAEDKGSLQEKEIEDLKSAAETAKAHLARARSNVEGLELEQAHSQAKLSQLSSLLEKRERDETDMQLYKKCIEVAEVSADREQLSQKLRMANAVIKRLEEELEGTNGESEVKSIASAAQMSIKLTETELKLDKLREKLSNAEKEARILRDENDKISKSSKGGLNGDDELSNKMKFLEEQNAAYAASLKALRIEIATRHVGTAFE